MPFKDQCDCCRFQMDDNCTRISPSFDGTSCDEYKKLINLEKKKKELDERASDTTGADGENPEPGRSYDRSANEDIPSDENIKGWLKFFLIAFVGFGTVLSLILSLTSFVEADDFWFSFSDIAFAIVYLAAGFFTIRAFYKREADAVFLAKTFVILCFASNVLGMFTIDEGATSKEIVSMIRSIIWCLIWFLYLCNSAQVKRIIPPGYRKTQTRDWIIISAAILLPLFFIGIGLADMKESNAEKEAAALASLDLLENQFTDGRIVLTLPDGVDCEESSIDGLTVFSVSDPETGAEVTIVSDYDSDVTKRNFNEYWRAWRMDDLEDQNYTVVSDKKDSDGDTTIFYKLTRIDSENPIDWEFVLVFDQKTGKVCLISGYSYAGDASPVADIISNLEFL